MITQGIAKEARQAGVKGEILGNVKIIGTGDAKPVQSLSQDDIDGLPF